MADFIVQDEGVSALALAYQSGEETMPYLKQQDERGKIVMSWVLGSDPFTVGRAEESNAQISDAGMSNQHFRIENVEGVHQIIDTDSTNGTFVNDGRVKKKALEDGDVVRAGRTNFLYEYGVSTVIGGMEEVAGKSIRSELKDIYKQYEDD